MTSIGNITANWAKSLTFSTKATEDGRTVNLSRTDKDGNPVTAEIKIAQTPAGGAVVDATRTKDGVTQSREKYYTPEQVGNFKQRLHDLGEKLAENPVTMDNGRVLDGHLLLKIDIEA